MIPEFVIGLFENEFRKVIQSTIDIAVKEFDVKEADLIARVQEEIGMKLTLVPEETETMKVVRKKGKQMPEDRCKARLKKQGGIFQQCSRSYHGSPTCLCKTHAKEGGLKFGTIDDPLPKEKHVKRAMV